MDERKRSSRWSSNYVPFAQHARCDVTSIRPVSNSTQLLFVSRRQELNVGDSTGPPRTDAVAIAPCSQMILK